MSCSMRIELPGPREGEELLAFLRGHGLEGRVVSDAELEVGYARGEAERLRSEVWSALRTWLAEQERPLVPATLGDNRCILRPPGE
jgi:hypothetical protein